MSNGDRWMPLYVTDYLGDTMHLSTLQHGAYMLLIMHYWKHGPLPEDPGMLAQIAKADDRSWKVIWPALAGFFTNGDGRLHQKRMDWERRRWTEISDKRRDAGKRGAEAKHRPHPSSGGGPVTPPKPQPEVVPKHIIPQPEPGKRLGKPVAIARVLPDPLPEISQQETGNCQPFATTFASVPVPVQKNNLTSLRQEKGAREQNQAQSEEKSPLTDGWQDQRVSFDQLLEVRRAIANTTYDLRTTSKSPQGKPAKLSVVQQQDQVLHGEIIEPGPARGPVDPIRSPDEQIAEALGISLAEATAVLAANKAKLGAVA